jgi:hypothetical protein
VGGNRLRGHHILRRAIAYATIAMLIASVAGGCSFGRITINDTPVEGDVTFIVPGHTTLRDIVERLGAPDEMREAPGGAVGLYHFRDLKYARVNFGYLLQPWTPIQPDLVLSTLGLGTDVFAVTFDEQWIAQQHAFTRHPSGRSHVPWPF